MTISTIQSAILVRLSEQKVPGSRMNIAQSILAISNNPIFERIALLQSLAIPTMSYHFVTPAKAGAQGVR
ncbi:hypothetical protein LPB67_07575 [Undibacterium sp. Jales W-56]|uniref:hypothetical protein n=1 Tax=Undibacterium sp. Jales W-56 TaxID=2897325 RepID=UPI0021CE662D|nr:hypothetical protein [Undibacterium sp. Jales W-56]MCU6433636.1 hypothetical protein [Undibacterium sp. Jales W-56]